MKSFLVLGILMLLISCKGHEHHTSAEDLSRIKDIVRDENMEILYNVTIMPRDFADESKHHLVRFQVDVNGKTYNIPVFSGDILVSKDNYYDLYSFGHANSIYNKDSAFTHVNAYSSKVMDLYYKLNVHQIIGGLPHQGQMVRMKFLDSVEAVFVPDTNRIFNQYWRVNSFRSMKRPTDSLYISKLKD